MTRIEVLTNQGDNVALAGFFLANELSPAQAVSLPISDYANVVGEWWPSGGFSHWTASGGNAWYNQDVSLGEAVVVQATFD